MTSTTSAGWPHRTMKECHDMMTAPGQPWEMEHLVIKGRPTRVYKNLPKSIRDLWMSTIPFGNKEYIVYQQERLTYNQAHVEVKAIAKLLYSRGVRKGDRVAIVMRNYPEWITSFQAIHSLGAISAAVNAWSPPETLVHCLKSSGSKIAIMDEERAKHLLPFKSQIQNSGCEAFFVVKKKVVGFESFEEATRACTGAAAPAVDIAPDDLACIFFTSGTTSMPKAVISTQRQFLTNLINTGIATTRNALRNGEDFPVPDMTEQKALLLSIPLFHVTGNLSFLTVITAIGGKMVLMHKWDVKTAIETIKAERITSAGGVPSMAADIIDSGLDAGDSLQSISFGGAPASIRIPAAMKKKFPSVLGGTAYGLSETSAVLTSHGGEDYLRRPTSCGVPVPVCDVKIIDQETLKEVPIGSTGEIYCRGPNIVDGYYGNEKATKEAFSDDGWFQTGDIGHLDEENFLFISDRAKEIIIRGGENISSIAVENAFYVDSRIKDAAVVPVKDDAMGELVAALIVMHPNHKGSMTEQELIALVAKSRPKHEVPVMVVLRDEIVRNANGKIVKKDIKVELNKIWEDRNSKKVIKAKL